LSFFQLAEKAHDSFDYFKVDLEGFDAVWWRAGGVFDLQGGTMLLSVSLSFSINPNLNLPTLPSFNQLL
jgi:hypothetical protein